MNYKKVLSICIPTYNRKNVVYNMVNQILKCKSIDFDVIVVDNDSPDGTYDLLKTIKDERLKLSKNQCNIGGINSLTVLQKADSLYTLLLLDKDGINPDCLEDFLHVLQTKNVGNGFCKLNVTEEEENLYYKSGFESLYNTAYLSKHPSGLFWRTEILNKTNIIEKLMNDINNHKNENFGFHGELITSVVAMNSNLESLCYNKNLVYTEKPKDSSNIKTKIYSKSNLYFLPKMRFQECCIYLTDILQYNIGDKDNKLISRKIVNSYFVHLLDYLRLKRNKEAMLHYGLINSDIKKLYVLEYVFIFIFWFLFLYRNKNFFYRLFILLSFRVK